MRTEGNKITPPTAGSNACRVIIGIGVSPRAGRLKDPRVGRRPAGLRVPEASGAAILGRLERQARALTPHHPVAPPRPHLQRRGAHLVQVAHATGVPALPRPPDRRDRYRQVVAVHQAHVVEVLLPKRYLHQRRRRSAANPVAEQGAAAVAGGTAAAAGAVEDAVLAAPDAAGPADGGAEGGRLVGEEAEAAAGEDGLSGARLDRRPDRVGALVV